MKLNKNNSYLKRGIILFLLLLLFISISAFSYANTISEHISNTVFRLHVLANSDNVYDQELKYVVRDEVLAYMRELSKDATSKQEIMQIANNHIEEFKEIAENTVRKNGYDYMVSVSVRKFCFSNKRIWRCFTSIWVL